MALRFAAPCRPFEVLPLGSALAAVLAANWPRERVWQAVTNHLPAAGWR